MKTRYIVAALAVAYALSLLAYSHFRLIDGDEGYYASAARLVAEGQIPYKDFFYPQTPALPFVYGSLVWLIGPTLASLRVLSMVFCLVTVALWSWYLLKRADMSRLVAFTAILLLAFNPFFVSWGVTVKTYALANLLVTIALIGVWRADTNGGSRWLVISGLATGLLVSTRLLYATVPLVILGWLTIRNPRSDTGSRFRNAVLFLSGVFVACVPSIVLFIQDPEVFIFNNIGYHMLRSETPSAVEHSSRILTFILDLFIKHPYISLQCLLVAVGTYPLIGSAKQPADGAKTFNLLILAVAIAFAATTLIPTPLYEQYLTNPLSPLLLPLVAAGLQWLWRHSRIYVYAAALTAFSLSLAEFRNENAQASMSKVWTFESYNVIVDSIRAHTAETDIVLSPWPGFVFESGRKYMPGFENHFGMLAARKLTGEQQARYHINGMDDIVVAIHSRQPKVIVLGSWVTFLFANPDEHGEETFFNELLLNYRLIGEVEGVDIYERTLQ